MKYVQADKGIIHPHFIAHCTEIGQLIHWQKQLGQNIQVRQYQQLRWLLINEVLQSVIEIDEPDHLLFPHLQVLADIWRTLDDPSSVLEIGLGAGAIRNYLQFHYPNTELITAEKNPEIIHCYKKYFGGHASNNLHCQDVLLEIKTPRTFDWIIIDIFSQLEAPVFLFQKQFYDDLSHILAANGHLFINFLTQSDSQLTQLKRLLRATFTKEVKIEKISGYTNHILWLHL
ncbi:spermidine synthase [Pseudoalteromonas tunicata]|jgi:spermidine synthase|uniref:SAM-dependent methyltransferase n=1 Tax=Pseudoalteromonas tunicata D2 TaxID=87626 RepID=A4C7U5_9GAMM|nr:SAM-dependent methyltransferase [Pseudoalteromonas tunicata]ATC93166.1 hypothetical protein PTUN_a0359 [Pseudoalteromonas tunicata]AXT32235.1 SAM-dependent methyltransferase [Pseudoalteromonas tunicata]EAR28660.1 hypothetical protein PTD2_06449 [Pseudoalteromonas tunicata D2]MDP4983401.1 SAM-dependent methyltransferase [Pseudoalteromonas tunicata]MDP5212718.1 SAM-dependent methyltransferase [Pseudoalteromonas tunicata]